MTIKRVSANVENDKRMLYKLTKSPNVEKLKNAVGNTIYVKAFCYYNDVEEGENEKLILTLLCADGTIYGTNSKTAMSNFSDLLEFFIDDIDTDKGLAVEVSSSISKNGREFILLEIGE